MSNPNDWKQERKQLLHGIEELKRQGVCYVCYDLETRRVFRDQHIVYEDNLFKVVLESYPQMKGHTILVYKPHREDMSFLSADEACRVFQICVKVVNAIKKALGAEKVYLNTMCDGEINHLHFQFFPRYAGDPIGSSRFVSERRPLTNGNEIAQLIRSALLAVGKNNWKG